MKPMNLKIDEIIINALKEDMPFGDVSTDSVFTGDEKSSAAMIAKEDGVAAGLSVASRVFEILDPEVKFKAEVKEGDAVEKGDIMARVEGKTASLLKGERTALNFLQHMCGIATATRKMADALSGTGTKIVDTRKTTPGLRILEKYAVTAGGGANHRYSLSDAVMLKDNHIHAAGGIKEAVEKAKNAIPHTMTIEVETSDIDQVEEALEAGADIIMLDNMDYETVKKAIDIIDGKAVVEISGNVDFSNIREKAVPGVDIISSGSITHSVKAMDISMKFL